LHSPPLSFSHWPKFLPTITALSLHGALQPGKMSLFCALAEWFYTVGSLLQ
jgi:hypothetical protein